MEVKVGWHLERKVVRDVHRDAVLLVASERIIFFDASGTVRDHEVILLTRIAEVQPKMIKRIMKIEIRTNYSIPIES